MITGKSGIFYYLFFGIILVIVGVISTVGNWALSQSYNPFRATVIEVLQFRPGTGGREFASVPQGSFGSCFLKVKLVASNQEMRLNSLIRPCARFLFDFYKPGDKIIIYTDRETGQIEKPIGALLISLLLTFLGIFSLRRAYLRFKKNKLE